MEKWCIQALPWGGKFRIWEAELQVLQVSFDQGCDGVHDVEKTEGIPEELMGYRAKGISNGGPFSPALPFDAMEHAGMLSAEKPKMPVFLSMS